MPPPGRGLGSAGAPFPGPATMDCEAAEPLIEAFCDDELDVAAAASLLAHLESCAGCASLRREAETRKAAMQQARPIDRLPDEVRARLLRQVGRPAPSRRRAARGVPTGRGAPGRGRRGLPAGVCPGRVLFTT